MTWLRMEGKRVWDATDQLRVSLREAGLARTDAEVVVMALAHVAESEDAARCAAAPAPAAGVGAAAALLPGWVVTGGARAPELYGVASDTAAEAGAGVALACGGCRLSIGGVRGA